MKTSKVYTSTVLVKQSDMTKKWSTNRAFLTSSSARLRNTNSLTALDPKVAALNHKSSLLFSKLLFVLAAKVSAIKRNLSRSNPWQIKYCRLSRIKAFNTKSKTKILLKKYLAREDASQEASMTNMRERWRLLRLSRISSVLLLTKKKSKDCAIWSQPTNREFKSGKQLNSSDNKLNWEISRSSKFSMSCKRSFTPRTNSAFTDASARRLLKWRRTLYNISWIEWSKSILSNFSHLKRLAWLIILQK